MSQQTPADIVVGTILEFFESRQVLCGVCMALKNQRLSVLTEQNREISLARSRLIHVTGQPLNVQLSRDELVQNLTAASGRRKTLMAQVNVEELWSLLEEESEGFEVRELAEFVFSSTLSDDHIAAVQRVLLQDRLFFQFKDGKFYARSAEKLAQRRHEIEREAERETQLIDGAQWLHTIWHRKTAQAPEHANQLIANLKDFALFHQEAQAAAFVKELLKKADIPVQPQSAFRLLVRLGIWHENENLYLPQQNITADFPEQVLELAARRAAAAIPAEEATNRRDLRDLSTFTIDSALTRDYDDALSLRSLENGLFEVGVHIADAAAFVTPGDELDLEAQERASTIYLPDARIAMLPSSLSEGVCSLKAGEDRPTLSFLMQMDAEGHMHHQEIVPSIIRVREQATYEAIDRRLNDQQELRILHQLGLKFRKYRLAHGAVILPLPEVQVHVNSAGMIQLSRYEKETPSQIMVSEWMIAANALAAAYLAERGIPAIFRSQAECKPETDPIASEYEIFHVYRRRRLFARAELDTKPGMHCSLAMPYYTSITSPIRRYIDLSVQRQLKHALKTETAFYTEDELRQMIAKIAGTQSKIFFIQRKWTRYWILKYLEQEDIKSLNVLVLNQNDRFVHLLSPDLMMEINMPIPENSRFQSGELIRVKIERLNPREDTLRVQA